MPTCQHANMVPPRSMVCGLYNWCLDHYTVLMHWPVTSVVCWLSGGGGSSWTRTNASPKQLVHRYLQNNICYFKGPTPTFCTFVVALVNYSAPTYCSCAASPSPVQATSNSCCARTYAPAHLRLRHSHLLHHIPHSHHLLSLMSDVWCLRQSMFHRVGRVNQTHNQQWEFETFLWQQNITWTKSGLGLSKFISRFRISSNFCRGVIGDNIHYLTF